MSDYDFLDSFEGDYKPQHAFRSNLETVPAGDYDCEIADAAFDAVNGKSILRVGLRMGGRLVEHTYWLDAQSKVNGLCADLAALGFDAAAWGTARGKPLKTALPAAVAKLPGVKFRATKATRQGTGQHAGKTFHDLHIAGRIAGTTPPAPAPVAAPAVPTGGPAADPYDIPF